MKEAKKSGEVLGTLVSGLLMWHRFNTLDVELDMAKKNAIRHLRMQASVRSLISLLTLLLSFYFHLLDSGIVCYLCLR